MKKLICIASMALVAVAMSAQQHKLWYNKPASHWLEALPIGNSHLGAMVYVNVVGTGFSHFVIVECNACNLSCLAYLILRIDLLACGIRALRIAGKIAIGIANTTNGHLLTTINLRRFVATRLFALFWYSLNECSVLHPTL